MFLDMDHCEESEQGHKDGQRWEAGRRSSPSPSSFSSPLWFASLTLILFYCLIQRSLTHSLDLSRAILLFDLFVCLFFSYSLSHLALRFSSSNSSERSDANTRKLIAEAQLLIELFLCH